MGPLEQIIHMLNFAAPAWGVALFCVWGARLALRPWLPKAALGVWPQMLLSSLLGTLVLLAGLWLFGVDGKMATYGALVLTCASLQWWMCGAWRGR